MTSNQTVNDAVTSNVIPTQTFDGIHYPLFFADEPKKHLAYVKAVRCDTDDIFVCSYPKSGTHWLLDIVSMLKNETASHAEKHNFIDIIPSDHIDAIPAPRIFASHLRFDQLPADVKLKRSKVIYCLRDPKDLAVSLYNFTISNTIFQYKASWSDFFEDFCSGKVPYSSWFDHVLSWEKAREVDETFPLLFVFYEELHKNTRSEILRIAEFLKVPPDDALLDAILNKTSLASMRKQQIQYYPYPVETMDLDHNEKLFRKGEVGDWKNWFTKKQCHTFDKLYHLKMKGSNMELKFLQS